MPLIEHKIRFWKARRKVLILLAMLLSCGMASAQVVVKGNVYGGGEIGKVTQNTTVTINGGTIKETIYGGGMGSINDEKAGLVNGNTTVTMTSGQVERSIYGGGELGSVGTFTAYDTTIYTYPSSPNDTVLVPKTCQTGTGITKVELSGGWVGLNHPKMPRPGDEGNDDFGYVFCGGRGEVDSINYPKVIAMAVSDSSCLIISDSVLIAASAYGGSENGLVLRNTRVEMAGGQIGIGYYKTITSTDTTEHWDGRYEETKWTQAVTALQNNTLSTTINTLGFHMCDSWPYEAPYDVYDMYFDSIISIVGTDITYYRPENSSSTMGTNGHTYFGNLFGGGSGFYPMAPGVWRRSAGQVRGDAYMKITGGHILSSVYGANETTDVVGKVTIEMNGGTVGVPRTAEEILERPIICNFFGGGKGDQRVLFNKWTNQAESNVTITGGTIFGSIFGGGEDGHVLGDVTLTIGDAGSSTGPVVGTWGYTGYEGNVYGSGRGFSGNALTAGNVGGNVDMTINGGLFLGSVFGGGRNSSVGPKFCNASDTLYGQMQPDDELVTHGHITVKINGGIIGNDNESKLDHKIYTTGGNVYGGSWGTFTLLDGSINKMWPRMSKVKSTNVTIKGYNTVIKGNVFGGCLLGTVTEDTEVNIEGGTIWRNVCGSGFGSDSTSFVSNNVVLTPLPNGQYQVDSVRLTPRRHAGRVYGNTTVNIRGGWVKRNVYGGGSMASVGTFDSIAKHPEHAETVLDSVWSVEHNGYVHTYTHLTDTTLNISWPYAYTYKANTGKATVNITGGRVGITGFDYMGPWNASGHPYDRETGNLLTPEQIAAQREYNGYVFGASRGEAGERYANSELANVRNTEVTINYTNSATPDNFNPASFVYDFQENMSAWPDYPSRGCITAAVYGGGENGHVNDSTIVTLNKGLVGFSLYGGGKGTDKYMTTLNTVPIINASTGDTTGYVNPSTGDTVTYKTYETYITSITSGKVFGNTHVTVNDGYVLRNVYGGGNSGSVGKGNYAGGPGDYQPAGYGEQWAQENYASTMAYIMNSGHTYVTINGGQIGTVDGMEDELPTGNVFGGSRGEAAPNVRQTLSPRIKYYPEFFLGYANHTHVVIGKDTLVTPNSTTSPRIYGSVYGGGRDGHVRWGTEVVINDGYIGNPYVNPATAQGLVGTYDLNDAQWLARGNVYGAGSGISKYDSDGDGVVDTYSTSAGSVTQFTNVTVNGGLIHRNVYGGGSLASVGPPRMGLKYEPGSADTTCNRVTIRGRVGLESDCIGGVCTISPATGADTTMIYTYGGDVFGASRGLLATNNPDSYSTSVYTQVTLDTLKKGTTVVNQAIVPGDVYGGGELGLVRQSTAVYVKGGKVGTIGYDYKHGHSAPMPLDSIVHTSGGLVFGGGKGIASSRKEALVQANASVTVSGGHILYNVYGGGEVASVGLRDSVFVEGHEHEIAYLTDFKPCDTTFVNGYTLVTINGGQVGPAPKVGTEGTNGYNIPIGLNGIDGYVFGGGKGIGDDPINLSLPFFVKYYDIADVNNAEVVVNMPNPATAADSVSNRIWGSVFGGAEDGHVLGNAKVQYISGLMGTDGTTSYDGNIFGGGRNFSARNYSAGRVRGNDTVTMCGGTILGSIFGGGRLSLTGCGVRGFAPTGETDTYTDMLDGDDHGNIYVKVNGGTIGNERVIDTFLTQSMGDVYGGGKGTLDSLNVVGHPKAASLLLSGAKNTTVVIADSINNGAFVSRPTILGSVYGGGEVANVGHHTWKMQAYTGTTEKVGDVQLKQNTGKATVVVSGGTIGAKKAQMRFEMADGTGNYNLKYNDDRGHVFGGGKGKAYNPADYDTINPGTAGHNNMPLIDLMATVGETDVTITDTAFVKGSVYGGGMSGHVLGNTKVTVSGGQIGAGYNRQTGEEQPMYAKSKFFNPVTYFGTTHTTYDDVASADALLPCYHWKYNAIAPQPFDPVKIKTESNYEPTTGETWFGSVYGGGSGYYPYFVRKHDNSADSCVWNPEAGKVYGNAEVVITGGHILSNVYGAAQTNDVGIYAIADAAYHNAHPEVFENEVYCTSGGKATVTISGGSVGVPRTIDSIADYPIVSNVFGGGQGDFREQMALLGNVDSTRVTIKDNAIVYGSVFGGSENGHVVDNTKVIVKGGIVGTSGLSGADGSVYGGGKGAGYYANTTDTLDYVMYAHAGRVGGNTKVSMTDGQVLGCVFGGGQLALTGVGKNGWFDSFIDSVSVANQHSYDSVNHGLVRVEVGGGTIGHKFQDGLLLLLSDNDLGNVYGGGRGDQGELVEDDLGRVANAIVSISGSPKIYGTVFGGGQMANVGHWNSYASWYTTKTGTTKVTVKDTPTIGTEKEFKHDYSIGTGDLTPKWTWYDTINGMKMISHTCTGNVYGGGQGDVDLFEDGTVVGTEHGHCRTTEVNIAMDNSGHIMSSVFGGAEDGAIWGNTKVTIAGGIIGTEKIVYDTLKLVNNHWVLAQNNPDYDSTYSFGSVFGGSFGKDIYTHIEGVSNPTPQQVDSVNGLAGRVYGNTLVNITGGQIRGNVYGGGNMASVGIWDSIKDSNNNLVDIKPIADPVRTTYRGNATVNVSGGVIGPLDGTGLNAYVFGGGKGFHDDTDELRKAYSNVDSTFVTVSGGKI